MMGDIIYLIDFKGKLYELNMSKKVPKIISKMNQISSQETNSNIIIDKIYSSFEHVIFKGLRVNKFGR